MMLSNKCEEGWEVFEEYVCDVLDKELGWHLKFYKNKYSQIFIGENKQGIEIKYQRYFIEKKKGYLYFEVMARRNWQTSGEYVDAGIFRHLQIPSDNTVFFVAGNEELFYLFSKVGLQDLYNSTDFEVKEISGKTSIGFSIPMEVSDEKCLVKFVKGKAVFMNRIKNPNIGIIYHVEEER